MRTPQLLGTRTHPREVLKLCRASWLQAVTEGRFCVARSSVNINPVRYRICVLYVI